MAQKGWRGCCSALTCGDLDVLFILSFPLIELRSFTLICPDPIICVPLPSLYITFSRSIGTMEILVDDISPQINYISTGQEPVGEKGTWDNGYKGKGVLHFTSFRSSSRLLHLYGRAQSCFCCSVGALTRRPRVYQVCQRDNVSYDW
jgi:hypothetical protein